MTWVHSSRVGTTTSACGAVGSSAAVRRPASTSAATRTESMMGSPKPRVLPVPVLAWPMTSWPVMATGRVISWIGNGVMMPTASRASAVSGRIPSSRNVVRAVPLPDVVRPIAGTAGHPPWDGRTDRYRLPRGGSRAGASWKRPRTCSSGTRPRGADSTGCGERHCMERPGAGPRWRGLRRPSLGHCGVGRSRSCNRPGIRVREARCSFTSIQVVKHIGPRYQHTVKSKIEHVTRTTSGPFPTTYRRLASSEGH